MNAGNGFFIVVPAINAPVAIMHVRKNKIRFFMIFKFMFFNQIGESCMGRLISPCRYLF
jgi:hypothetical protein